MAIDSQASTTELDVGGAEDELSRDDVFEVLSNQRRRHVFHYLKRHDREVYVRELADQLAAWENDKRTDAITYQERKRVKTALQQYHLPKMAETGFVEYDTNRGAVRLSDVASNLEVYLDVVPGWDVPWGMYYLGLSVVGILVVTLGWLDGFPASLVSELGAALFCSVALLVSATVHTYYSYSRLRLGTTEEPPKGGTE